MPGRTDSRPRLLVLLVLLVVFGITCVARLGYWQIGQRAMLVDRARAQVLVRTEIPAVRGTIYDRSGTTVLATTVLRDRLVAFPAQLTGTTEAATAELRRSVGDELVRILRLGTKDGADLHAKLASGKAYVVLARELDEATSAAVQAAIDGNELRQIGLEPEQVRVYPQAGGAPDTSLAAHLLGFVNRDGAGQYGIEGRWQEVLGGAPRVVLAERDAESRPLLAGAEVVEPGAPGAELTLTVDASLQLRLEQEVYAAWVADRAASVSAVVMDPTSGEILAAATYPSYDANAYRTIASADPSRFLDPIVSAVYEPGSVFKLLTAAAALEAKKVTPKTRIADAATLTLDHGRAVVANADRASMGVLSFEDAVAYSRNVILSKVALRLGRTTREAATVLYGTWTRLGIGSRTGVDVAGELPGIVHDPAVSTWRQVDLANGAFGQGVAVTLLQLATAYCAMVNGGTLPTPHVVRAIGNQPTVVADRGRVLSAGLSRQLIGLMKNVVAEVDWYRDRTRVPGYAVGGKTGTAQIWDSKKGAWKRNIFNYSFVGFVGRTGPELVVAVRISEGTPTVVGQGHLEMPVESFELFRRIATDAVTTLGIAPATRSPASSSTPGP